MSNVAKLFLDDRTGKWTATYNGKVLAASPSEDYVVKNIRAGRCTKANAVGVTDVIKTGETEINNVGQIQNVERFDINERFAFTTDFVHMVADRTSPSLVITGDGGLGKTHTVLEALYHAGLKNINDINEFDPEILKMESKAAKLFTVVKGYSTAKGLYRTLYENRYSLIVFDDCDSVLDDPVAKNLLKGALDSYDKRVISWNAEASFGGPDDLPRSFEFRGGIIFISNKSLFKIDQAVRSRSLCVDLTMNTSQKIERMEAIILIDTFMPDYGMKVKKDALKFLEEKKDETNNLNFRTLQSAIKIASRGGDWKGKVKYMLTAT